MDTTELTCEEKIFYKTLVNFINTYGCSPSFRELCEINGGISLQEVYKYTYTLKMKGYINRKSYKKKSISLTDKIPNLRFNYTSYLLKVLEREINKVKIIISDRDNILSTKDRTVYVNKLKILNCISILLERNNDIPLFSEVKSNIDGNISIYLIKEILTSFKNKKLTSKELEIINIIYDYEEKYNIKITIKEIMIAMNCKTRNTPYKLLKQLKEKKIINDKSATLISNMFNY